MKDFIVTYLFQIVINIVYFMFQQLFWHPRFRGHLKHFLFKSHDLNLTKNVLRLETTGTINVQIFASEEDTILCYESPFSTQVQMLKSFNSLLIDKVQCVSSGNIAPEFFFQPTVRAWIFFWRDGLVQECFSYALAGCFFFPRITPPPPPSLSEVGP